MKKRSMRAREFRDDRQLSLFPDMQEKAYTRQRKPKEHKHDSPSARLNHLERRGERVAFVRRDGPLGWKVIPPEEVAAAAGGLKG